MGPMGTSLPLILVIAVQGAAQDDGLAMAVDAGFSQAYREGSWTPVRVTVGNTKGDLRGVVRVEAMQGNVTTCVVIREFESPKNSVKTCSVCLFLNRGETAVQARFINRSGVAVANALVRQKRGHVLGHLVLAETFYTRGFHDLAIDHCEQALATDRGHVHARVLLARCYLAKKEFDQGVRELERALRASPKHAKAQMLLAEAHVRLKQYDEAQERYEKLTRDYPEVASPYLGLARIHLERGLPEAAALCYEEALRRSPKNPVAANNLAMTLVELGRDLDRAHQLAADLRARFPQSAVFADTYGWVCYHRRDHQEAVDALSFAVKRQPKNPEMQYHYGMALSKVGETGKSRDVLLAALRLSGDFEGVQEAKRVLAKLVAIRRAGATGGAEGARGGNRQN